MQLLNFRKLIVNPQVIAGLLVLLFSACGAKKGCLDEAALNYSSSAGKDDGSCTYPGMRLSPVELSKLEDVFVETSGLTFLENRLWTLTDAGGENKIYSLRFATGTILEEIELKGIENKDFEALSSYNNYFYVGDIGNNEGNREDLTIYRFPVPENISATTKTEVEAISFYYPEQNDFDENILTEFDAEAMLVFKDNIYVFTKNHKDQTTALYEIKAEPGSHEAKLRGTFDAEGLVTDASISNDGSKVVLIGHNRQNAFIWLLFDYGNHFFQGRKIKIDLGPVDSVGQVEGVTFFKTDELLISNEKNDEVKPKIYFLDISELSE